MRPSTKFVLFCILAALILAALVLLPVTEPVRKQPPPNPKLVNQAVPQAQPKLDVFKKKMDASMFTPPPAIIAKMLSFYAAKINFYGKVIDQNGTPVKDATIEASVDVAPPTEKNHSRKLHTLTDAAGQFSFEGLRGISIYVKTSKKDYYRVFEEASNRNGKPVSDDGFSFGFDNGRGIHQPDKTNPVVFMLYKGEPSVALVHRPEGDWVIQNNGQPRKITLERQKPKGPHYIEVQCWSDQTKKDHENQHTWRMKISIPNGGMAPRSGRLDFVAPLGGYVPSFEYEMPASLVGLKWQRSMNFSFFVRFNDGIHARFDAEMMAGYDPPRMVFESQLNPESGSRNLTADPDKNY